MSEKPDIYIHVIYDPNDPGSFGIYAGSGKHTLTRILYLVRSMFCYYSIFAVRCTLEASES